MNISQSNFMAQLTAVIGADRMLSGDSIGADYRHDELPGGAHYAPEAVCIVESAEEVSAVLRICNENGIPVTPRGAGTGLVGGSAPLCGGVVLAMNKMNQILCFDEETLTARVQPGVLLSDLKAAAESRDLYYPPDPSEKTATIGGNAATNAGGPSAVKYGTTRNYITAATVILADGSVLKLGGATGKDNSGYNLLQLVIGSEGTLGVITELTVRLIPKVKADVTLILPFMDGESCGKAALRIRQEGFQPAVLEYLDTDIVEFSGKVTGNPVFPVSLDGERVGASLVLTLEGKDDDELDIKMEELAELAEELECLDILVVDSPTLKRDVWSAYEAFHTAMGAAVKHADELNVAVPPVAMAEYIAYVKELGEEAGLGVYAYGHAGDGGLHIYTCGDETEAFNAALPELMQKSYAKCCELGGAVSSEHGIGHAKKDYLQESLGEAGCALMRRVKAAFDPNGILNPGKVI